MAPMLSNVENFDSLVSEGGGYFGVDSAFAPSMLSPSSQFDFRASAFDWLDFHVPDIGVPGLGLLSPLTQNDIDLPRSTSPARESRQAVQPWPFDQTQDFVPHQYQLPPLRLVLQGTLDSQNGGRGTVPEGLVYLLSEPWLPSQEILEDAHLIHAVNLLKTLLDAYFSRFHAIQPVTHMPTWTMASCPTVLLAAMACIGAMISDESYAVELSESLSGLCIPMITWAVSGSWTEVSLPQEISNFCRVHPTVSTIAIYHISILSVCIRSIL
jgi:uncharacterized membrane protein